MAAVVTTQQIRRAEGIAARFSIAATPLADLSVRPLFLSTGIAATLAEAR